MSKNFSCGALLLGEERESGGNQASISFLMLRLKLRLRRKENLGWFSALIFTQYSLRVNKFSITFELLKQCLYAPRSVCQGDLIRC